MTKRRIEYLGDRDSVKLGNKRGWRGKCALLERGGTKIATFMISPGQERSLKAGKRINITDAMISAAEIQCGYGVPIPGSGGRRVWKFETGSGLSGAKLKSTKRKRAR